MPLNNRLKEYRAKINVNQTEMGKLVGVSRQTISQIERGDYSPSVPLPLMIAQLLDAIVQDILSYGEDEINDSYSCKINHKRRQNAFEKLYNYYDNISNSRRYFRRHVYLF